LTGDVFELVFMKGLLFVAFIPRAAAWLMLAQNHRAPNQPACTFSHRRSHPISRMRFAWAGGCGLQCAGRVPLPSLRVLPLAAPPVSHPQI
jgi:hypothetical protein